MKRLFAFPLVLAAGLAAGVALHAAGPARPVRIALVSDPHSTRGTKDDQPLYRGRLERVIADVNAAGVDFVLLAGDLTQNGKDTEYDDLKAQAKAFRAPVFFSPGNHDLGQKVGVKDSTGPTAARVALYEQKIGPTFFAADCAGVRIVGVNSPVLGSGLPVEKQQWDFLEHEFGRPSAQPRIVFMHYPLFVHRVDEPGGDYFNIEPAPRARLLALLQKGGVTTLLTGHLHYPLVNRYEHLLSITTLPVSFGLPLGKQPQGWTLVTLRSEGEPLWEFRTVKD